MKKVWQLLKFKNIGELHDHYVKTDVLLLADVFERFRDMTLDFYQLDACHFITAPGLAWSAAMKMKKVKLDLLCDPLQYNFFETGMRGGISMICKKHVKANNPYIPETYDPSKPTSYINYYDANNLYGSAMRMPLPTGLMRLLTKDEIDNFDITNIPKNGDVGYTLEVDLKYPEYLHDAHNSYPVAPEHKTVQDGELSPHSRSLWEKINSGKQRSKIAKLIPTLGDKSNYVVHYRNLQLYQELGLQITKIHRILEYHQTPWLRPYIDFNSEKRKSAKNDFEKDFFKLMCNAVFGKTMENLRNRVDVKLIQTKKQLSKYVAKPSFDRLKIFNQDLIGVQNKKTNLFLNKPIYIGQSILDLSKLIMYDFHYNVMLKQYGKDNITLAFTDTDSLLYHIHTDDVYRDMKQHQHLLICLIILQIILSTTHLTKKHLENSKTKQEVCEIFIIITCLMETPINI